MNKKTPIGKEWFGLIVLTLVGLRFFWPMLFEGKMLFDRDFSQGTYPVHFYLAQAYHQGFIPHWIHGFFSGAPFLAKLHPGVFYPPSILFFLDSLPLALNLYYVLHFFIMMLPTYLLVRNWNVSITGALASALTAAFSAYLISTTLVSNLFLAAVWAPLVILLFQKYVDSGNGKYLIGTIFAVACQTLAGNPETSIMTCGLTLLIPIFTAHSTGIRGVPWKRVLLIFPAVLLSLGLVAIQLAPTYKLVAHSDRSGGISYDQHTTFSLSLEQIKSVVLPDNVDNAYLRPIVSPDYDPLFLETLHLGIFPVLFLILSFWFLKDRKIRFWLVIFWVGIFLAVGRHNPLYPIFFDVLPLFKTFRYPEKFYFLSAMALVSLVGLGWDKLYHSTLNRDVVLRHFYISILLLAGLIGWAWLGRLDVNPGSSLLVLLVFGTFYIFFHFQKVRPLQFKALFLLLLMADLWFNNYAYLYLIEKRFYEDRPVLMEQIEQKPKMFRTYSGRIRTNPSRFLLPNGPTRLAALHAMKEYMYPYVGILYGIEYADGMAGFGFGMRYQNDWYGQFFSVSPEKRFTILKRNNVRYWINVDPPTPYINNVPLIFPHRLVELEDALPRAFLVSKARRVEPHRVLDVYYDERFDPRAEVLLSDSGEFPPSEDFQGEVESIVYGPNRVSLRTHQTDNGYLVLLDTFFPGWTVTVDGQPGQILRANHFFRAVRLGPGDHHLIFEFTPEGWTLGLWVSGASLGAILLLGWWTRSPRRQEGEHVEAENRISNRHPD